jgi:hypothetical protein
VQFVLGDATFANGSYINFYDHKPGDPPPPRLAAAPCVHAARDIVRSAFADEDRVAAACSYIEHLPASETRGGSWLRTYEHEQSSARTLLLSANVAVSVATLLAVALRVASHLRVRALGDATKSVRLLSEHEQSSHVDGSGGAEELDSL